MIQRYRTQAAGGPGAGSFIVPSSAGGLVKYEDHEDLMALWQTNAKERDELMDANDAMDAKLMDVRQELASVRVELEHQKAIADHRGERLATRNKWLNDYAGLMSQLEGMGHV